MSNDFAIGFSIGTFFMVFVMIALEGEPLALAAAMGALS